MEEQTKTPKPRNGFNKFLFVYFISSIVIIAIVSVGFTFKAKEFRYKGPFGFMISKVIRDLDLNTEQKAAMDKITEEIKVKMNENKMSREEHMSEFGSLFKQDKLDKEQLMALADKHESKRQEMRSFFIDELIKAHAILTPDQRTKAVEKMKELKEKRKEWRDKHPKEKR